MTQATNRNDNTGQEGFTLVEVVIASAIMMTVFVALLGAITLARRMQAATENKIACLHMARRHMEPFSGYLYDHSEFDEGETIIYDNPETGEGERGSRVITKVDGEDSKNVVITINWMEPSGKIQSVSLSSTFSRSLHRR